jgi:alpha-tubulin suppressor-like RCC1 family protein
VCTPTVVDASFACAVLDDGEVKCWGDNSAGELGLGDTTARGTSAAQMGNSLPAVTVGAGRTAMDVTAGKDHACALLDTHDVKCWGANAVGQLGLGDTLSRGNKAAQMGAALPAVNLGAGRTAQAVTAGVTRTCALLDNGTVKCWGINASTGASGQLGLGDTINRGTTAAQMTNLPSLTLW